jgi:HEPN domain-containing protein
MSTKSRAIDWLKQAQNDLSWSKLGLENKFYSQSCFTAQQAGEKAIKAIAYYLEFEVRGHSITKIAQGLKINGEIEEAGKFLDLFYISARYPDALPGGAPFEVMTKMQAELAIKSAELILQRATADIENHD